MKELHYPFSNNCKPVFLKNESSSNYNMGSGSSSKIETDDVPVSAIISQSLPISIPVVKQVYSQSGIESSIDAQIRNGKCRGDGRSRNQLLPRYRPQITDEELQQISSKYPMAIAVFVIFILFPQISMIMLKCSVITYLSLVLITCQK